MYTFDYGNFFLLYCCVSYVVLSQPTVADILRTCARAVFDERIIIIIIVDITIRLVYDNDDEKREWEREKKTKYRRVS